MRILILSLGLLFTAAYADAQSCPPQNSQGIGEASEMSILHGKIFYHDELRVWLGLKLDRPTCGENEVQLTFSDPGARRHADSFRECSVTVTGKLYYTPTAYYSTSMAISDGTLEPDSSCRPLPTEPNPSAVDIPSDLRAYHVSITVDYRGKGHVEAKVWTKQHQVLPLRPWQAYVSYSLNGSADVIWFSCRKGFGLRDVTQIPKSSSGILLNDRDMVSTVLQDLEATNTITFTCQLGLRENSR